MKSWPIKPWRISLKWFLLATTAIAVLIGTVGKEQYQKWQHRRWLAQQQRIAEAVTAEGGQVVMQNGAVVRIDLHRGLTDVTLLGMLRDATEIQYLDLGLPIDDSEFRELKNYKRLRELHLTGRGVTNRSLEVIGDFKNLEVLQVGDSSITDEGLKHLSGLTRLELLDLSGNALQGQGLRDLNGLQELKVLILARSPLAPVHLAIIRNQCRHESTDDSDSNRPSVVGLYSPPPFPVTNRTPLVDTNGLAQLNQVRFLILDQPSPEPGMLGEVTRMKSLKYLVLVGAGITDQTAAELRDAQQLRELSLQDAPLTDAGLIHLEKLTQLSRVWLSSTQVTAAGVTRLSDTLPDTAIESPAARFDRILGDRRNGQLVGLTVWRGDQPDAVTLARISKLTTLEVLSFRGSNFGDEEMKSLSRLTKLESLDLGNTRVTDDGLRHLQELRALQTLELRKTSITGRGFAYLKSLPNLKTVDLDQSAVDDDGLEGLGQVTSLENVQLQGVPIRGHGLRHLRGLPKVRSVTIYAQSLKEVEGLEELDQVDRLALYGPGFSIRHVDQLAGMENLRLLLMGLDFDQETLLSLSQLRRVERLHFHVRDPSVLPDIRALSAKLPETRICTGSRYLRGGLDWTPPPDWPPPSEKPGIVSIQAVLDKDPQ